MKKKFSILIFSIVGLCLLSLGVSVFTTSETASAETVSQLGEEVTTLNAAPTKPQNAAIAGGTQSTAIPFVAGSGELENYYNMSDEILIMTENQSTQGLCWDFTTNKIIETFYAKHFGEYYNLSETWVELAAKKYAGSSYTLGGGGNFLYYENAINYYGIAMESQVPYEQAIELEGKDSKYSEYFTYYQQYANTDMLQNIEFDYYGNYNQAVGTSQYDEIKNNIKHYLKNYGSMYVSVKAAEFETNLDGSTYICSLSTSYDSSSGLHAISIIGWDDYYEADGHTGAWLALNSWGVESQKIVHVMYDDVFASEEIVGLTGGVFSGVDFEDINVATDAQKIKLVDSNTNFSSYTLDSTINSDTLQKNIFSYSDTEVFYTQYTFPETWDLDTLEVKAYQYNEDVSDYFEFDLNAEENLLTAYNKLYEGTFDIIINVENNGYPTTYNKQMVIFTGGEVASVDFYEMHDDGYLYAEGVGLFNLFTNRSEFIYTTTEDVVYLNFNFNDISKISKKIKILNTTNGEASYTYATFGSGRGEFVAATESAPSSNSVIVKVNITSGNPKIYFYTQTLDNQITYFTIQIINLAESESLLAVDSDIDDEITYKTYQDEEKIYLDTPTYGTRVFLGYFYDEERSVPLEKDSSGYYLTTDMLSLYQNPRFDVNIFNLPDTYITLYTLFMSYNIIYDLNGGSGSLATENIYHIDQSFRTPATSAVSFEGHTLLKWQVVGTEKYLAPGTNYSLALLEEYLGGENRYITLKAVWTANSFNVDYSLNGGNGDVSPYETSLTYSTSEYYTIPDLSLSIAKSNYVIDKIGVVGQNVYFEIGQQVLISELAHYVDSSGVLNLEIIWKGAEYDITYYVDGEILQNHIQSTYTYGEVANLSSPDSREGYDFDGWYTNSSFSGLKITSISAEQFSGDITLYGRYIIQTFSVNLYWFDDPNTIQKTLTFDFGQTFDARSTYQIPLPNDAYKTSTFANWSDAEGDAITANFAVTQNTNVYAHFEYDYLPYTFNFYNFDGTFLATSSFVFGQVVYYDGAEPQKEATQEEVFMFAGWALDKDNPQLLQDVILGGAELQFDSNTDAVSLYAYFTSEPRKYSCVFYDVENNGIPQEITAFSLNVEYGNEISLDFLVPSKPSTNTHHYIFEGWFENNGYFGGNWGEQVTIFDGKSDLELYAKYTKEDVLYTVTFYYAPSSIGGLEIVENLTQNVTYQTHIDLSLIQGPAKPSTIANYFVFAGWALGANSETIETSIVVESNISLYAVYNSFLNTYKITFLIPTENGYDVAFEASEEYGNYLDMSLYNNPQKPSSYSKDFVFENWYATADYQGGIVNHIQVLGDKSYYAKFTEYEKTFEIKLFESDGEELTSFNYQFNGNSISLANVTTSKPKTAQYEFEFAGWYSKNGLENNGDWGEKVESIDFSDANTTSEADIHINLYPKFVEHIREYVVNFYNNGVKLTNTNMHDEYLVEYGEVATFDRAVQKSSTNKYYYIFEGWAKTQNGEAVSDLTILQSDNLETDDGVVNFYAQFSEELRTYYLKLYYEKDSSKIYKTIECIWEEEVNLSGENLTKENTDKHYFEFKGWRYSETNEKCPSNIVITGDLSLYGDFTQQTIPFKLSQKAINIILIAVGGILGIVAIVVVFKVVASRGKTGKNSRKAQRTIAKYRAQQIDFEAQRKEIEEIKERARQKYNKK